MSVEGGEGRVADHQKSHRVPLLAETMVRMSVLNDALKNITNAERRGKRQVK